MKKMLLDESMSDENYKVLLALTNLYHSAHMIDLEKNTVHEYNAARHIKEITEGETDAVYMMNQVMKQTVNEKYLEEVLKFCDLTTIAERMDGKNSLEAEFVGVHIGWFRARFVRVEENENKRMTKTLFTTEEIDSEKRRIENLIRMISTDELTGVLNRRALEEELSNREAFEKDHDFTYISMDVDGLKRINDSLGHAAGDELLLAAAECIKTTVGEKGKVFRTGGDEFQVILSASKEEIQQMLSKLKRKTLNWSGKQVAAFTIACGVARKDELPNVKNEELARLADERMYENKNVHHKKIINAKKRLLSAIDKMEEK
ncbi:MAG: GGDEF domain-containing protein [Lachnospiraceae bacterium]|nr:GGDEF domain-containing protein [Lachnospiraceae bacterium]